MNEPQQHIETAAQGQNVRINPLIQHPDGSPKWANPTTVMQRGDSYGIQYESADDLLREANHELIEENAQLLKLLGSIVTDVEAMQKGDYSFGPFSQYEHIDEGTADQRAYVEWPNLAILLEKAKRIISEQEAAQ